MADGSVKIDITADDKDAQKKLNDLRRGIEKTTKAIDSSASQRNVIAEKLEKARAEAQKTADELERLKELEAREGNVTEDEATNTALEAKIEAAQQKALELQKQVEAAEKLAAQNPGRQSATHYYAVMDAREQLPALREEYAAAEQEVENLIEKSARLTESLVRQKQTVADMRASEGLAEGASPSGIIKELEKTQITQEKQVSKLEQQEQAVLEKLQQQTAELQKQKEEAGAIEKGLQEQTNLAPQLQTSMGDVSKQIKRGFGNILKWGFGIRSLFVLFRRLRSYIKDAVRSFAEADPETKANLEGLKASLNSLKLAWGAAFAPILNAVTPILQTLISWLTAAANAVARFFAILGGKSSYKKINAGMDSVAESAGGAGAAAAEAEKQIMGFDEINKLNGLSSGGGGGGGGAAEALETVEELIDMESFWSKLALSIKDVLFDWSDLTPEQIAEKAIAGLSAFLGGAAGFMIAGVPGAIIGTLLGLTLGLVLDTLIFDHDGVISKTELADMISLAITALCGGVIGFVAGGPAGALIGATVGLGVWAALKGVQIKSGAQAGYLTNQLATAMTIFTGAVIGFAVGGPGGALIGATIGLGVSAVISAITFDNTAINEERSKYRSGLDWFIVGVLGLPSDQQIQEWGEKALGWLAEGFQNGVDSFVETMNLLLVWPFQDLIADIKEILGISSPSTVFQEIGENTIQGLWDGMKSKWDSFNQWLRDAWNNLSTWWSGLKLSAFHISLPHIGITWEDYGGSRFGAALLRFLGIDAIPHLSVSWGAKGGILDAATLIGAGEAGKEALVPLERNTGWIDLIADGIIDRFASGNRLADAISGKALPAVATGQVVPPNAVSGGFGGDDITRLLSGITAAFSGGSSSLPPIKVYIDGKEARDCIAVWDRRASRASG